MKRVYEDKIKTIRPYVQSVLGYMGRRHVATVAAACAFWLFLSLVPLVILVSSILPYTSVTQEALLALLSSFVPQSLQELLETIIAEVYRSNLAVLSLSLLTTLWSSSAGFYALIRGLEEVYEQPHQRSYVNRKLRAILYTVVLMVALLLAIGFLGLGSTAQALLEARYPKTSNFFTFLPKLRYGAVQGVLVLLFACIYRFAPNLKLRFVDQLPGAAFASLGWTVFSLAFSFWISRTNGYGTYGSLATVAVVMVWMYYCITILLWGGCLNRAIFHLRERAK